MKPRINTISRPVPALLAILAAAGAASAQTYTVDDLGTLGGPTAAAFAINDAGLAAGVSTLALDAGGAFRAFRWDDPALHDLGALANQTQSLGQGIGPDGGVVGTSFRVGERGDHALLAYPGSIVDLGEFQARAVNTTGNVAGDLIVVLPSGWRTIHACRYTGSITDLGTLGGASSAGLAINNAGWVAGSSYLAGEAANHACLWTANSPIDLGTLPGGGDSQIGALNNAHAAAGFSRPVGAAPHAMLVTLNNAGQPLSHIDLGTLGGVGWSFACGLNDAGAVVGTSNDSAVLWTGGVIADLNTMLPPGSAWRLQSATAINQSGQIVGWGLHNGQPRAFRLTPSSCYADCDLDGELTFFDFLCYTNLFNANDPAADCDLDGELTFFDFLCFTNAFNAGC
jgi:probable HAF family extracellular repeat protein